MNLELVSITATDKVRLPGLLYSPPQKTKKVGVWLHGMGDSGSFYMQDLVNSLGKALTGVNIAFLAPNNRGAHNIKNLKLADDALPKEDRHYQGGTYYELIADCVHDIDGAVDFLRGRDFSEFYLLGHSSGANKICVYHARAKQSPFSKYVLAGPGDDSGLWLNDLGEKKFRQTMDYAKKALHEGRPLHTMPRYSGMNPFSAQSAFDILNPDGDYNTFPYYERTTKRLGSKMPFKEYRALDKPLQIIFGEADEYAYTAGNAAGALELFREYTDKGVLGKSDFSLIAGADHSFKGAETAFARKVADWLSNG